MDILVDKVMNFWESIIINENYYNFSKKSYFMKYVYLNRLRIHIDSALMDLAHKAVDRIYELAQEDEWIPSLEIAVPRQGDDELSALLRVQFDTGLIDTSISTLVRALSGNIPRGNIVVDLGEYGVEGWRSYIDNQDLRKLPDIYFTGHFLHTLVDDASFLMSRNLDRLDRNLYLDHILPDHQSNFSRAMVEYLDRTEKDTKATEWHNHITEQASKVATGNMPYSNLADALSPETARRYLT